MTKRPNLPIILLCIAGIFITLFSTGQATPVMHKGEAIYKNHCAGCHGVKGEGFLQVYPPIKGSEYVVNTVNRLPCIIRHGLKGELLIKGKSFNGIMPGNKKLSTEEITALVSYLLEQWGDASADLHIETWLNECTPEK